MVKKIPVTVTKARALRTYLSSTISVARFTVQDDVTLVTSKAAAKVKL